MVQGSSWGSWTPPEIICVYFNKFNELSAGPTMLKETATVLVGPQGAAVDMEEGEVVCPMLVTGLV